MPLHSLFLITITPYARTDFLMSLLPNFIFTNPRFFCSIGFNIVHSLSGIIRVLVHAIDRLYTAWVGCVHYIYLHASKRINSPRTIAITVPICLVFLYSLKSFFSPTPISSMQKYFSSFSMCFAQAPWHPHISLFFFISACLLIIKIRFMIF